MHGLINLPGGVTLVLIDSPGATLPGYQVPALQAQIALVVSKKRVGPPYPLLSALPIRSPHKPLETCLVCMRLGLHLDIAQLIRTTVLQKCYNAATMLDACVYQSSNNVPAVLLPHQATRR